jgi:hypothetical protein
MFKVHQDTPCGGNNLGTLVVALPTDFEGGESILSKEGEEAKSDWYTSGRKDRPNDLHWVFYACIGHGILPVKTGHRLPSRTTSSVLVRPILSLCCDLKVRSG